MKEEDLVTVRQQLLDTQVKVKVKPEEVAEREGELHEEIKRLHIFINELEERHQSLDKDKDAWKVKYWDSLKKLDDAHRLINVHLHNAARYREECRGAEQIQKATYDKLEATEHQLAHTKELLEASRQECRLQGEMQTTDITKLNSDILEVNMQIKELTTQREETLTAINKAEENIRELETEIAEMKELLNVEKFQVDCQTDLQMLQMHHTEVQATPQLHHQECQIESDTDTRATQTIDAALCSMETQTVNPVVFNTEAQTDHEEKDARALQLDAETQTQPDPQVFDDSTKGDQAVQTNATTTSGSVDIEDTCDTTDNDTNIENNLKGKQTGSRRDEQSYMDFGNGASIELTTIDSDDAKENKNINIEVRTGTHSSDNIANATVKSMSIVPNNETARPIVGTSVVKYVDSRYNTDEDKVLEETSDDRHHIGRFKFKNTEIEENDSNLAIRQYREMTNILDADSEIDIDDMNMKIKPSREVVAIVPDRQFHDIGLSIPKIDIEKSIDCAGAVTVDPDEFSIELTQDENKTDTLYTEYGVMDKFVANYNTSSEGFSKKLGDLLEPRVQNVERMLLDNVNEMDKSITLNWEVSEEVKVSNPKAKKHKLAKETITDQFSEFDMSKEKFEKCLSKDDIQPKQIKLGEKMEGITKGMQAWKPRSYSSMFQAQNIAEDEANGQELSKVVSEQTCSETIRIKGLLESQNALDYRGIGNEKLPDTGNQASSNHGYIIQSINQSSTITGQIQPACNNGMSTSRVSSPSKRTHLSVNPPRTRPSRNIDFLQKYRDIIAKTTPVQRTSGQQATEVSMAGRKEYPTVSPDTISMADSC